MIAILQFDGVSLRHLQQFIEQGDLPALSQLRARGQWIGLETPALSWEGATYFTLYSGRGVAEHGLYFPFMWDGAEQRVFPQDHFPAPEMIWDRIGGFARRSLVIDPYEGPRPRSLDGKAISGWQFKHKVTLRGWSVPGGLERQLVRRFGRPPLVEEVYGRPSARYLSRMRERLLGAPKRAAEMAAAFLAEEHFDLVWITLSSGHIAGHWFLEPSRLPPEALATAAKPEIESALRDTYTAVDDALSRILAALPPATDIIILSPTSMSPSSSRTHLLPGMLKAMLSEARDQVVGGKGAGDSLWRLRAVLPIGLRAWVARALPTQLTLELTARLETRGVDWGKTRAFMAPSGNCGYIRINLKGRERAGIVSPEEAPDLLQRIATGLKTFRDADGQAAVKHVEFVSESLEHKTFRHSFPDLIVHWSDRLPAPMAGVISPQFGEVPSPGWGSGRTGEHCDGAWALIVPARSKLKPATQAGHIMDIAPTICAALGVEAEGLRGQALLEPRHTPHG